MRGDRRGNQLDGGNHFTLYTCIKTSPYFAWIHTIIVDYNSH